MRRYLLASSALLALPGVVQAQTANDAARPTGSVETAQAAPATSSLNPVEVTETPQIAINNAYTPTQAYDPVNVNGVGQLITDAGGGFIGTCTATLINRRTVIFAAHCVNGAAATSYGANTGGTGIGIGFETNTRRNAPGEVDELVNWLLAGPN